VKHRSWIELELNKTQATQDVVKSLLGEGAQIYEAVFVLGWMMFQTENKMQC